MWAQKPPVRLILFTEASEYNFFIQNSQADPVLLRYEVGALLQHVVLLRIRRICIVCVYKCFIQGTGIHNFVIPE